MADWTERPATEIGQAIERGEVDPVALCEDFLAKIDAHEMGTRIYARLTPDRARAEAAAASDRAARGARLSPLDGVPVSWKDLFDSAGVATESGSKLLEGRVPERDAEVLKVATAMGLVCLGKTHMSELAFSGLGLNPVTGTPPCVNDPDAVPGGSSSGAAASVAFGLAAAAVGSDTGGSVRVPSAWNDLVGLKTTAGRVSCAGAVPLAEKFDTVGPLCRTVADCAAMLAALEGTRALDLRGAGDLKGRRYGVLKTIVLDDLRDAPAKGYEDALSRLEAAGAELIEFEFPEIAGPMGDAGVLYTAEAWGIWGETIAARGKVMFDRIRERFEGGKAFTGADYVAAWRRLQAVRRAWAARVAEFDAVLCPTVPNLPPKVERLMTEDDYYVTENLLTLRNTRVGNLMGLSVVTLPTGVPSCGISLMGRAMGEEPLLRLAVAAERALAG
ncbi:amidase [Litorisediminicola beolgyonensis]|uniref:Amidase n=1 Tax=Litorisediminicola beolgyonensis TaxID=1173614 RepID=A0ABW3ZDS1_9RHOB